MLYVVCSKMEEDAGAERRPTIKVAHDGRKEDIVIVIKEKCALVVAEVQVKRDEESREMNKEDVDDRTGEEKVSIDISCLSSSLLTMASSSSMLLPW